MNPNRKGTVTRRPYAEGEPTRFACDRDDLHFLNDVAMGRILCMYGSGVTRQEKVCAHRLHAANLIRLHTTFSNNKPELTPKGKEELNRALSNRHVRSLLK